MIRTVNDALSRKHKISNCSKFGEFHHFGVKVLFTSALAGGISLESEWQQVFLGPQDFSQYSNRSH